MTFHEIDVLFRGGNALLRAAMGSLEHKPAWITNGSQSADRFRPVDSPRLLQQPVFVLEVHLTKARFEHCDPRDRLIGMAIAFHVVKVVINPDTWAVHQIDQLTILGG